METITDLAQRLARRVAQAIHQSLPQPVASQSVEYRLGAVIREAFSDQTVSLGDDGRIPLTPVEGPSPDPTSRYCNACLNRGWLPFGIDQRVRQQCGCVTKRIFRDARRKANQDAAIAALTAV